MTTLAQMGAALKRVGEAGDARLIRFKLANPELSQSNACATASRGVALSHSGRLHVTHPQRSGPVLSFDFMQAEFGGRLPSEPTEALLGRGAPQGERGWRQQQLLG